MVAIPKTMNAIDPAAPGGPEVLTLVERPVPVPGAGEVLVRVAATGVNRPEVMQRKGMYPPPPGASSILGMEIAGTIVAVGEGVGGEQVGQPVCALIAGGRLCGICGRAVGQCLPVPEALTMIEAAAMPETLFTVWTNLFERAYAIEGDTVLVHGGTSGIGTMAIALVQPVRRQHDRHRRIRREMREGARDRRGSRDQLPDRGFRRAGEGDHRRQGGAAVLDMVGGDYVPRNLQCLAEDGRHVSIAVQGGADSDHTALRHHAPPPDLDRLDAASARRRSSRSLVADELARTVWPHVAAGRLKPVIDKVFPLAVSAADAHTRMEAGDHVGKIVLEVG